MQLFSFTIGESTYKLDLAFDDAAIMEKSVAFDVTVTRFSIEDGYAGGTEIVAKVEIFPWENAGTISVAGMEIYRFDLVDRGDAGLERFLQSIPVPDPILGCALKAGVSSLIGQAIKCRTEMERAGFWGRISEFAGCMRNHFGAIGRTALRRTFGCMISGGLL